MVLKSAKTTAAAAGSALSSYSQQAGEPDNPLITCCQGCSAVQPAAGQCHHLIGWKSCLPGWLIACNNNYSCVFCAFVYMPAYVCGHSNEANSASIIRAASLLAPAWWMWPFLIFRYWDVISHSSVRRLGWFMIHSFTWATQFISCTLLTAERGFVGIKKKEEKKPELKGFKAAPLPVEGQPKVTIRLELLLIEVVDDVMEGSKFLSPRLIGE